MSALHDVEDQSSPRQVRLFCWTCLSLVQATAEPAEGTREALRSWLNRHPSTCEPPAVLRPRFAA